MSDFSVKASDLLDQFMEKLKQVDLTPAVGLPGALNSYLAASGINANVIEQVGVLQYARSGAQQQAGDILSRGFQNMKSFLFAGGQAPGSTSLGPGVDLTRSLDNAKEILGSQKRSFVEPNLQNGRYSGLVLGETAHHVLLSVDGRGQTATAIEKSRLSGLNFGLNKVLNVQFRDGQALGADKSQAQSQTQRRSIGR
jgi:hypothetical protein